MIIVSDHTSVKTLQICVHLLTKTLRMSSKLKKCLDVGK